IVAARTAWRDDGTERLPRIFEGWLLKIPSRASARRGCGYGKAGCGEHGAGAVRKIGRRTGRALVIISNSDACIGECRATAARRRCGCECAECLPADAVAPGGLERPQTDDHDARRGGR